MSRQRVAESFNRYLEMERYSYCTDLPPTWFVVAFPTEEEEGSDAEPLPLGIW